MIGMLGRVAAISTLLSATRVEPGAILEKVTSGDASGPLDSTTTTTTTLEENVVEQQEPILEYTQWNPDPEEGNEQQRDLANQEPPPELVVKYKIWSAEDIEGSLLRWDEHYSEFIQVTTSQDAYNLQAAGGPTDCPFQVDQDGCLNYIATIQDFVTYPEASEASKHLPEILLSGCLHGNEQVGPSAVMEATSLLLMAASCTQYPRWSVKDNPTEWENDVNRAKECRQEWKDYGYKDWQRQWLARLVATRRIVVIPTANALGYYQSVREENHMDPNRDFPFDLHSATECMRTIAGRTLNEVFREHVFQLSLTFHAGMEVVGFEWGAPTYKGGLSPDDVAQNEIGSAYSRFGGGFPTSRPYNYGPMNDAVYPVRGGMEDWAYAGSWDPQRVIQCQPTTYDPYPVEKTIYDDATLRVFNMLVETSNNKMPKQNLGTSVNVLDAGQLENGHVARNLRLALLAAELVQPYVAFRQVNEVLLTDDVIPGLEYPSGIGSRQVCQKTKHVVVPRDSRKVTIQWQVGGALTIDDTKLWYAKWSDIPYDKLGCIGQPDKSITDLMKPGTPISSTSGTTRFKQQATGDARFSASIDISGYKPHDLLVVLVAAKVDQGWANMPSEVFLPKNTPPQSHMANARTKEDWHYVSTTSGNVVQGRVFWFSDPLTIELGEFKSSKSTYTVELSQRVPEGPQAGHRPSGEYGGASNNQAQQPKSPGAAKPWTRPEKFVLTLIFFVAVALVVVGGRAFLRTQMRQTHRDRLREFIADPTAPSPGLKEKSGRGSGGGRNRGDHTELTNGDAENGGDLELKVYRDDADLA